MARTLTVTCLNDAGGPRFVDAGRRGMRRLAIAGGGPADRGSAARGNEILGQPALQSCIETTLFGGKWQLAGRGYLALTGADHDWRLDNRPAPRWRAIPLDGKHVLTGGLARRGCRGYLCLRGHWQLPRILGSVEPGLPGAAVLRREFRFTVEADDGYPTASGGTPENFGCGRVTVPVVPGPEWEWLDGSLRHHLLHTPFRVGAASDRQGIRLEAAGGAAWPLAGLLSSPVLPGTVQWTPGGPILLGPDAQTVGGYPRVLVACPLPDAVFQLRPGGEVRLQLVTADP